VTESWNIPSGAFQQVLTTGWSTGRSMHTSEKGVLKGTKCWKQK